MHEAFRRGWPEVSRTMPTRVKLEVERFLTCGDARFGFVEVSCADCAGGVGYFGPLNPNSTATR